jgi:hypothetical protein
MSVLRLHNGAPTHVTELVYRHELRPVIQTGVTAMDALFSRTTLGPEMRSHPVSHPVAESTAYRARSQRKGPRFCWSERVRDGGPNRT